MREALTAEPTTVGVVGGGQLGRMLAEAAAPLGVEVVVLDPTPDCPAAAVARDQVEAGFDDPAGIARLAERVDVLTVEIELAAPGPLAEAGEAAGVPVHPAPSTLATVRDKLREKRALADAGVPVPAFRPVDDADDLAAALDELGSPVMLKARRGGYDGRGNLPIAAVDDLAAAVEAVGGPALAEAMVDFERELSVVGARGVDGVAAFDVVETVHEVEILRETVAPARTSAAVRERAQAVARDVLDVLDGRGVFGIELFETRGDAGVDVADAEGSVADAASGAEDGGADGAILVNEIAPRPHNSGHWTIEGAVTSQFEQHVRAVAGLPLGATDRRGPTVTANVLGDGESARPAELSGTDAVLSTPGAHLHWYGKREVRPLRKMGHLTLEATDGEDRETLLRTAWNLRDELSFK